MLMIGRYSNKADVCRFKWSTPVGEIGSKENPESANDGREWDVTNVTNIHEVLNRRLPHSQCLTYKGNQIHCFCLHVTYIPGVKADHHLPKRNSQEGI